METGEKRRRIRMKPVLLGMLAMLLTSEPVSGKHSFYVKLEPQARKALPTMKAGTVSGAGVYESGSTIVITATANPGWVFKSWETGLRPYTSDTLEVVITQDLHYTAQFKPDDADLEASAPVSWRVVPNPVRTEIFIEGLGDADVERVLLYDMQSRLLHAWESGSGPFSVEDVPAGMYVLEVRFANGRLPGRR